MLGFIFGALVMTIERKIASIFNLNDENWMKHANPISVWTRYSVLPLIVISFWSRQWIDWWCLVPGLTSILWVFFNPVLFNKAKSTNNWASKAVLSLRSRGFTLRVWFYFWRVLLTGMLGLGVAEAASDLSRDKSLKYNPRFPSHL